MSVKYTDNKQSVIGCFSFFIVIFVISLSNFYLNRHTMNEKKNDTPIFFSLLLYLTLFMVLCGLLTCLVSLFFSQHSEITIFQTITFHFVALISVVATSIVVLKWVDKQPFSILGLSMKGRGKDVLYGFLSAVVLYAIGFGVSWAMGVVHVERCSISWRGLVFGFLFFVIVSLTEEIMCRGYVLGRLLRAGVNKFMALFISSVLFAVFHIFNPNMAFLPMLNMVIAGGMLGVSYLYTRNLWFPISLHLFWNWIQGPLLGYEVSGTSLFPSFLQLSLPEINLWNGGFFGFEGSIICTFLMLVFIGVVIIYFEKANKQKKTVC